MSTTLAQALRQAAGAGLERLDAQLLLGHVLDRPRAWLIAHDDDTLTAEQALAYQTIVSRRAAGEPVAYLLGHKEFHGLNLAVSPATLVPRPDTETLVDWALEVLAPQTQARVLDLGTGSGCIALALKAARPNWSVFAVDRSPEALAVARANGERLGLAVNWLQGSWLEPVAGQQFDLIVSNPPYIASADPHLEALRHEPLSALASGADGLEDLRQLAQAAPPHLPPGGWLLFEHGYDQADAVAALLTQAGLENVSHRQDLAGHRRCTGGRRSR
ncbi:release factor glutamine methyltransferase [Inhella inkyongensis]|uniref:Release factor glutamine methyltransferase n=1 Tax=Inhella inkyongensis TaxID=392593 RepID=A0A840S3D1_9BURK|nr:peptide chain release factor N(5)-glutamine methyltransferase [Inhella inkyongensis]MBB5203344.1 release factor glutamine methyltransferase [Inhella inkyongensis]